jgi:antitoxin YefM
MGIHDAGIPIFPDSATLACVERNMAYNKAYIYGGNMDAISYTHARANLAGTMNRVCDDHEPVIITRNGEKSVVMMSLDDYKALEETAYLLRSPSNAKRLMAAIEQLEAGRGKERELIE